MSDWPKVPKPSVEPPAGYFDTLPARALSRLRTRRNRRYKQIVLATSLLFLGSSLVFLINPSRETSSKDKYTYLPENQPIDDQELLTWILTEKRPADSPASSSVPQITSPQTAPTTADTILTREDILDYLLDENYLDV